MVERTTTVQVNEDGRCTIPVEVREALGFNGEETYVEITVEYNE
jgi:bifunctional DNA-binding transcriptional regulator/antitoxin component of YhaV-PrlF toxin-antitoxin module